MSHVVHALRTVFSDWTYVLRAAIAAAVTFCVLLFLPAGRVSAIVLYYQVTGLDAASLFILIFFSLILGTLFSLNYYLFKKTHESKKKITGRSILSLLSSFLAGMFGSAVCVACVSLLLGFLGLPTITFLVAYRQQFFLLAAGIALVSLYFTCQAVVKHETCKACKI